MPSRIMRSVRSLLYIWELEAVFSGTAPALPAKRRHTVTVSAEHLLYWESPR